VLRPRPPTHSRCPAGSPACSCARPSEALRRATTPDEFLGESVLGRAVFEAVQETLSSFGDVTVSTTRSQIAFKRRRGFAYIWLPGMYLARPQAEVVVSIALDRAVATPRFKEIAHPSDGIWQHHLEVRSVAEVDDEVRNWLRAAYDCAG
jgi:hypothetical protein